MTYCKIPVDDRTEALVKALGVMVLDRRIRAFLEANDPKALEQARKALVAVGAQADPLPVDGG